MVRRKREKEKEIAEEAANLRLMIEERKNKLKQTEYLGMTKEEQEKMLGNLKNQYEALDNAYLMEQRRQ